MPLPALLVLLLLSASLVSGCAKKEPETFAAGGIPAAKVVATSKISMPAAGGQTIAMPRHMGDARALWSPLSRKERQFKYDGPLPPMDMRLASWLPKSEEDVMRSYLYRLTHGQSGLASRSIARAEQYMPIILRHVQMQGLPAELACLPMVESAFQPRAVSPAGAAGLWQLMPDTARRFGLTVNDKVDERFDVEKATAAATAYLEFLYREFQDWPLAIASYNCGEGKMRQALRDSGAGNLSELTAACRYGGASFLAEETLRFVPQFTAAVQVMSGGGMIAPDAAPAPQYYRQAPALVAARQSDGGTSGLVLVGRYTNKTAKPAKAARAQEPPRSKRLQ